MIRNTPEQDPVESLPSVSAHDNEIDSLRFYVPDDLLCRMWDFLEWVDRRDASGS